MSMISVMTAEKYLTLIQGAIKHVYATEQSDLLGRKKHEKGSLNQTAGDPADRNLSGAARGYCSGTYASLSRICGNDAALRQHSVEN